jgi:Protein of unknown function (DUF3318)
MHSKTGCVTAASEVQRLIALLPEEMRSQVSVFPAPETSPVLNSSQQTSHPGALIQIDFRCWQSLSLDQRNLLFWHAVAHRQAQSMRQSSREVVVMSIGGIAFLIELLSQNLLGVATTLAVTGLAGYQLYQHHYGERALRAIATADREAIKMAVEFGYSFQYAYDSLWSALQTLAKQKSQRSHWKKYQVRLRVLEMLYAKEASPSASGALSSLPYPILSPCS